MLNVLRVNDAQRLIDNADHLNYLDATKETIVFSFSSPSTERMSNAGTQKQTAVNSQPLATTKPSEVGANHRQPTEGTIKPGNKKAAVPAPHATAKQAPAKKR